MKLNVTDEQIQQMAANAVNASSPMGLGHLHFEAKHQFTPADFQVTETGLFLDYVEGRMVKFRARKYDDGFEVNEHLDPKYQSWCGKYPTWDALVASVQSAEKETAE